MLKALCELWKLYKKIHIHTESLLWSLIIALLSFCWLLYFKTQRGNKYTGSRLKHKTTHLRVCISVKDNYFQLQNWNLFLFLWKQRRLNVRIRIFSSIFFFFLYSIQSSFLNKENIYSSSSSKQQQQQQQTSSPH